MAHHVAERILGVNVFHNPGKTVERMKLCAYLQHRLHPGAERPPRHPFEIRAHHAPAVAPAAGLRLCHWRVAPLVLFHEAHIAMASALPHLREFGLHPVAAAQGLVYHLPDEGVEFQ